MTTNPTTDERFEVIAKPCSSSDTVEIRVLDLFVRLTRTNRGNGADRTLRIAPTLAGLDLAPKFRDSDVRLLIMIFETLIREQPEEVGTMPSDTSKLAESIVATCPWWCQE